MALLGERRLDSQRAGACRCRLVVSCRPSSACGAVLGARPLCPCPVTSNHKKTGSLTKTGSGKDGDHGDVTWGWGGGAFYFWMGVETRVTEAVKRNRKEDCHLGKEIPETPGRSGHRGRVPAWLLRDEGGEAAMQRQSGQLTHAPGTDRRWPHPASHPPVFCHSASG